MTHSLSAPRIVLVLLALALTLPSTGCRPSSEAAVAQIPAATATTSSSPGPIAAATLVEASTTGRQEPGASTAIDIEFDDPEALTRKFIEYNRTIRLTPEQERIKAQALATIPAPCCSEFSLATCCCPCNLAKSAWGLAAHLIVERGYGVEQVREAAIQWVAAVNPGGFTGDVCKTGGCNRSFEQNGCGGMNENTIL